MADGVLASREVTFLVLGAGIGFVAGVSPGPVLTLVVGETLRGGWLRGAAVAAGPLLADGPIIVLAVLLLGRVPPGLVPALSLIGGLFLLYLAATTLLTARRPTEALRAPTRAGRGLVKGVLARALSPNPYLFWLLVGGPLLIDAGGKGPLAVAAFLFGYYASIVGSNVGLALMLHRWLAAVSTRMYRALLFVSALVLAVYGLLLLGRARSSLAA